MKPCKGCISLNNIWRTCSHDVSYIYVDDDLLGKQVKKQVGNHINITDMRSVNGQCGPERKLYESSFKWGIFLALFSIIVILITFGMIYGTVLMLDSIGR